MARYFEPIDQLEHEQANAGYEVPDYCANCGCCFMDHINGVCPIDKNGNPIKEK